MKSSRYHTPAAFKQALEQRLRTSSKDGMDFSRRRQLLIFDRFLARVCTIMGPAVILKGGLVLELRLQRARTTLDVDLSIIESSRDILDILQEAGRLDLGDFFQFEVHPDSAHPHMLIDWMKYEGLRFRAEARLADKIYGNPFGVDVAVGDPPIGVPDTIVAKDVLEFAGIAPPTLKVYPVETHIAEKLHAYTMPRDRENSRMKDLPDIALLAQAGIIEQNKLRGALEQTFSHRGTHPLPAVLPEPPSSWAKEYKRLVTLDNLPWQQISDVHEAACKFLNPILGGIDKGQWDPVSWKWHW